MISYDKFYKISFLICSIIYFLLNIYSSIDTIITIYFFISSFFLVFSLEPLPENNKQLKFEDVHKYYKSRMNEYDYLRAALLSGLCILYFSVSINNTIRIGSFIMIIWFIFIIGDLILYRFFAKKIDVQNFLDYYFNYQGVKLDEKISNEDIEESLYYITSRYFKKIPKDDNNLIYSDIMNSLINLKLYTSEKLLRELVKNYLNYMNSDIIGSEINELNENERISTKHT